MTCHLNFKTNKIKIGIYEIWQILCCCCFSFFLKLSHWLQHKYVTNCEISGSFKYSIPMVYIITEWSVSTPLKSFLGIRWVITKDNKSFPFSDRSCNPTLWSIITHMTAPTLAPGNSTAPVPTSTPPSKSGHFLDTDNFIGLIVFVLCLLYSR